MTFKWTQDIVGMQAVDVASDVQQHNIGLRATAYDPTFGTAEFVYLKGVANTAAGDVVIYDEYGNTTTRGVAGSRGPAAVAMAAVGAGQYGWYQIFGAATVNVAAGFVAAANVYWTATAGTVDDAVVAGDKIDGARSKTAIGTPAAGKAVIQLAYPSANANG